MSISTLESPASVIALDEIQAWSEACANAERGAQEDFIAAARKGDMQAVATFAGLTRNWSAKRDDGTYTRRTQTVGEVISDTLTFDPALAMEAARVLCSVAYGDSLQVAAARVLLGRMAAAWAAVNAGGV